MSFLWQNYGSVVPTFCFFAYPMKAWVGQNLQLANFPIYSIQTDEPQFGFLFLERGAVFKAGVNGSWEVELGISYRDVSAKCLSMRFSSWALQNALGVEGRRICWQGCWEQSAGCVEEFKMKAGISNEFLLFCVSLPSPRHIFHSQLSTSQRWSSVTVPMAVCLPVRASIAQRRKLGARNVLEQGVKAFRWT